jgi:hypothetical protein
MTKAEIIGVVKCVSGAITPLKKKAIKAGRLQ